MTCIKDRSLQVALVNGIPWLISKDEFFLSAPWGEGKLGPKGKTLLSDPLPVFPYEIQEDYSAFAWNALVTAYTVVRDLEPDGPRSAGRLERTLSESQESHEVMNKVREILTSGFRPELLSSLTKAAA